SRFGDEVLATASAAGQSRRRVAVGVRLVSALVVAVGRRERQRLRSDRGWVRREPGGESHTGRRVVRWEPGAEKLRTGRRLQITVRQFRHDSLLRERRPGGDSPTRFSTVSGQHYPK